jgi:hypothetical protein
MFWTEKQDVFDLLHVGELLCILHHAPGHTLGQLLLLALLLSLLNTKPCGFSLYLFLWKKSKKLREWGTKKTDSAYIIRTPPIHGQIKQPALLSQCKLAFNRRNVFMIHGSENSKGHKKKFLNQARRLFWPRSIHLCHQKPNPPREKVP